MKDKNHNWLMAVNVILLGLLMLVPGLLKLFSYKVSGVSSMLSGIFLFAWAPAFWAVILIIGEIGSGLAILTRWKLKYTAWIPVIILTVATLTVAIKWSAIGTTNWTNLLFHLIAISNYLWIAMMPKK
jgi:uncharacterized membrane protein YphA (DoxX/SURF4 family)